MTSFRRLLMLPLLALGFAVVAATSAFAEKKVALVIGNDNYANVPKLVKAVNDARTMSETLRKLGFQVMTAENQTARGFSESLLAFDRMIEKGDTAFFFFAGHGYEIEGQNYLLPVDVPAAREGQRELVRDASVLADRVIARVQNRGAKASIFVFDACRNNPFETRGTRGLPGSGGLAAISAPQGVFTIMSAGLGQTALDRLSDNDTNPNSVFTRTFVQELQKPGANLVQVAQQTRRAVNELSQGIGHRQVPAYFDQMVDDVYLNGWSNSPVASQQPQQQIASLPPQNVQRNTPQQADSYNAPIASFSRHSGGWTMNISIADPALAISWRLGESGEYRDTGFMDALDPRTRRRMPNPSISMESDFPAGTIQVRYVDASGVMQGPFPIKFDPMEALFRDHRKMLDLTSTSWLAFREFNGLLVYYTHIVTYGCAVKEFRYGIDTTVPDKVVKVPACNPKDPSAIASNMRPWFNVPPQTKAVSVELTYEDGSRSEIKTFRR